MGICFLVCGLCSIVETVQVSLYICICVCVRLSASLCTWETPAGLLVFVPKPCPFQVGGPTIPPCQGLPSTKAGTIPDKPGQLFTLLPGLGTRGQSELAVQVSGQEGWETSGSGELKEELERSRSLNGRGARRNKEQGEECWLDSRWNFPRAQWHAGN